MNTLPNEIDIAVIGGGQSGLAIAYHLKQLKQNYIVLDSYSKAGESWSKRWDSLKLFTPSPYNHLPGAPFPGDQSTYPTKQDVSDYLEQYIQQFQIPIFFDKKVLEVRHQEGRFLISSKSQQILAKQVVVATGPFHTPWIPTCAKDFPSKFLSLHSSEYRNPRQLQKGKTLVVGCGDSGAQIMQEIALEEKPVYFSVSNNIHNLPQEFLGKTLWWWGNATGILKININNPVGRWLSKRPQPLIGTDVKQLLKRSNVQKVGKVNSILGQEVHCSDQVLSDITNIIWATGFQPNFSWLKLPIFKDDGYPRQKRGVTEIPGLYFIGLPWMHTRSSATLGGVGKDAQYLSKCISQYSK